MGAIAKIMEPSSYYSKTDVISHVPTTHEEEIALFKRFYAGNPEDMSGDALAARNTIIENNLRYAALTALRHASRRQYNQELTSAANFGLIKALESRRHDPTRGRFTTFATKYIIGEICAFFRVSNAVSFPAGCLPDWPDLVGDERNMDDFSDPSAFIPADLDHEAVHAAITSLNDTERQMIELFFFGGHNVRSASKHIVREDGETGVSRQWATELRDRALINLRLALGVPQRVNADNEVELEEAA